MSDGTTLLQGILDEFEHECFMLRVEASETRARDDVVRKSYERIRDEFAGRIAATLGSEINGDTSDGYHTFNELYHHRAVLFSVIVRNHRDLAWKARKHHDGTMYDGMFIVGIETPKGQATYHYDLDPYWEMFDCEEREFAPEWDGHTPDDVIARIAELGSDDEYEAKMDELLCRLTNGKWSKSRSYSVDFMESCVDEAYEDATLGSERELIDLAHNAWSMALCAMQGMPIPAKWGDTVERGLRKHGINVDEELTGFEVIDE